MLFVARTRLRRLSRKSLTAQWICITLGMLGLTAPGSAGLARPLPVDPAAQFLATNRASDKAIVETATGLQYKVLTPGSGPATPTDEDVALITYEGRLTDGTVFDTSEQPTAMPIAGVVPGFSEALKLMPKGARYRFWIKPGLAYGDEASGPIPAHSVLVFDVELIDFLPESVVRQMQQEQGASGASSPPAAAPAR